MRTLYFALAFLLSSIFSSPILSRRGLDVYHTSTHGVALVRHTWTHVDIFGRNVIDKVSNQKTLYYVTSNNLRFCITWYNGKHENYIFTRCISAFPEFNQSLLDYFQSFWLTTHTHAAVWLPKSCNQCVQLVAFVGHGSGERKSRSLQQLDCVARTKHQCAVFWVSSFTR